MKSLLQNYHDEYFGCTAKKRGDFQEQDVCTKHLWQDESVKKTQTLFHAMNAI